MPLKIAFVAVLVLLVFPTSQARLRATSRHSDFLQAECLTVPNSQFISSLLSTIDVLRQVNQDTCMEGFDGTSSSIVKSLVSGGISQITSLVQDLLAMVNPRNPYRIPNSIRRFPSWVGPWDMKVLMQAGNGSGNANSSNAGIVMADVVVAQDGSGNFTKIQDAVTAAPDYTSDPQKHQAVALRSDSELSVFYRCEIKGYQDTLYTHTMRQFFRDCRISGTIDFIFGDGTVVFQNCLLLAKQGLPQQKNTVTAQGQKDQNQPTGFSFQFCNVSADSDLAPNVNATSIYLGRPWKINSRTVFMQSYISNAVRPEGWLEWNGPFALNTSFYGEFLNYGPRAGIDGRVKWAGFHTLNSSAQAVNFTIAQFIEGNSWLPATGIAFTAGFGN